MDVILSELDRVAVARDIIRRGFGEGPANELVGPLFWNTPDNAMAQIVSRLDGQNLLDSLPLLHLVAQVIDAGEYLQSAEIPSTWAEKRRVREGLLDPVYLSGGVGEGLGLAKVIGIPAYDYDAIAVYEALQETRSLDSGLRKMALRKAWMTATKDPELGYAGLACTALLYGPHFGSLLFDLIDNKVFTRESLKRLKEAGFVTTTEGLELATIMTVIRG